METRDSADNRLRPRWNVEFKDLTWALVVSQHRSLRQAAAALNVRQSTLSRRLRGLEYRLGETLFERSTGGTQPTAAGQEFLKIARRIVSETDAAFSGLSAYCRGESGTLSIGIYMALSTGNLRATLLDYRHRYPEVQIRVFDGTSARLLADLAADALDIAILAGAGINWNDNSQPLWHERVVAALPEGHPLCVQEVIRWADLRTEPVLINRRDPGLEFHRLLMAKFGGHEICHITEHNVGLDRLLSLVGAGLGLTLVLEGATGAAYPGVVYREIDDENGPTWLSFVACWRQANSNPALPGFLDLLRERYPDLLAKPVVTAS